jgi:hypothetical protein
MRIAFLVERPTQFEAPFFRHAARDPEHELRVLFTAPRPAAPVFDPELGREVAWGIDLLAGYPHDLVPTHRRVRWLARELRRERCDLLVANGYTRRHYLAAAMLARRAGIATALRLDSVLWSAAPGTAGAAARSPAPGGATAERAEPASTAAEPTEPAHAATDCAESASTAAQRAKLATTAVEHTEPASAATGRAERASTAAERAEPASPAAQRAKPATTSAAAAPMAKRLLFSAFLLPLFDLFLGVGTLTLDYLSACGVPAARRGLFPYAIDVEHFRSRSRLGAGERAAARARLGLSTADQAVLAVAKLNAREGPWDLLHALPLLPSGVRVIVAGDGPLRAKAESLAAELGPGRVVFLGYVPYPELPALYATCDLFVHAAAEERWGVSVAEALACGRPVVASSRVGAARDLIAPGRNGWVYPSGDAAALGHGIAGGLLLDPREVAAASREVLARWDHAAAWGHVVEAGLRVAGGRAS